MSRLRLFTSESVTEGHPDKVCDQVSDALLDAFLRESHVARVAIETLVTRGLVQVAGEVTIDDGYVEIPDVVRKTITDIGYVSSEVGFDGRSCGVNVAIGAQSSEIATLVLKDAAAAGATTDPNLLGAGDQGIMFGYATTESPSLMPLPIWLAHRLSERLAAVRKSGELDFLRPDGKTQVTIGYDGTVPRTVDTVLISTQHGPSEQVHIDEVRRRVEETVIREVLMLLPDVDTNATKVMVNPVGTFVEGGPGSDAGLTGRKIIVDTYGGASRHGGGAFSGKDPSKVDRSAAYALRWVAKNAVAAGLADRLEVQVAYAIGQPEPVGFYVETFGTGTVEDDVIVKAIRDVFDLRPAAIIRDLNLLRPIYQQTASYGHFGRELPDFTWEDTSIKADELRRAAKL
jgi:S-adenosylmethionine synthetase